MKKHHVTSLLFFTLIFLSGCSKLWNREIDCTSFSLYDEMYWFPFPNGHQFAVKNSAGDSLVFSKVDNYIWHTSGYTTDTGCGCSDRSGQLLTVGNDSIWFNTEMNYIENNLPQRIETIGLVWQGRRTVFTEGERTDKDSLHIQNLVVNDIRKYDLPASTDSLAPRTIYTGLHAGLLRIVLQNGNVWEASTPIVCAVAVSDFNYNEGWCD